MKNQFFNYACFLFLMQAMPAKHTAAGAATGPVRLDAGASAVAASLLYQDWRFG
jgi:hypothetical protein